MRPCPSSEAACPPLRKADFEYELPTELIAERPLEQRSASRLLHLDAAAGRLADLRFGQLPDLLRPGDLLVFNDTRVFPARLYGVKASGGKVEMLVERILDARRVLAHVRASKPLRAGGELQFEGGVRAVVVERRQDLYELVFPDAGAGTVLELLERHGHVPLPPYIARADTCEDRARYQTVYARVPGAVAAPTAGLHFDAPLLERLEARGVATAWVTLHVGAGTFQPMRVEELDLHRMHSEWAEVPEQTVRAVAETHERGGRVVAVGTTSVRALETAAAGGALRPFRGETALFIRPGYPFCCVDALITNFHLPGSTLLVLVAAFAGYAATLDAYRHAVAARYRFFSYGDAMLITRGL